MYHFKASRGGGAHLISPCQGRPFRLNFTTVAPRWASVHSANVFSKSIGTLLVDALQGFLSVRVRCVEGASAILDFAWAYSTHQVVPPPVLLQYGANSLEAPRSATRVVLLLALQPQPCWPYMFGVPHASHGHSKLVESPHAIRRRI